MDNIINEIKSYILFLKKERNLEITLHPIGTEQLISASELISFNIHENSHCIYVKTFPDAHQHCINRQKKIIEKCKSGSFCGTCYAGIKEYVYPITDGTNIVGFVCVSGYKNDNFISYSKRCSKIFNIPFDNLQKSISALPSDMPNKSDIDVLIAPLLRMLELAYCKSQKNDCDTTTIGKIIRFVNRNYTQNITIEQLCEKYSCSRSYISHNFKKTTGQNFREYLIYLRLRSAKSLLLNSKLNITEISISLGFCNPNHFSSVFKSEFGISPRTFRNQHK